jgi:hypothetical protein
LSDLSIVDYRNRSNAETKFGESSVAALPRLKRLPSRYLRQNRVFVRKTMFWYWCGHGRPASKLALASGEIPLIGSPISTSHHRITQIPCVPVRACICPRESKADKRDGRPMMSYRDQPGKHTGHVRAYLRARAAARQVGA